MGFPIRTSPDQSLVSGSPKLFAATHVLRRLLAPRHPPSALTCLTKFSPHAEPPSGQNPSGSPKKHAQDASFFGPRKIFGCQRPPAMPTTGLFRAGRPRRTLRENRIAASAARRPRAGGADRDRTDDLRLAKPALSQLSYSPVPSPEPTTR